VPFTSVYAGKYKAEDKIKNKQPRKSKQRKTEQNKTSLV